MGGQIQGHSISRLIYFCTSFGFFTDLDYCKRTLPDPPHVASVARTVELECAGKWLCGELLRVVARTSYRIVANSREGQIKLLRNAQYHC